MGVLGAAYTALPSPSLTWTKTFFSPLSWATMIVSDNDSGPGLQLGSAAILTGVRTGGSPSKVIFPVTTPGPSAFAVAAGGSGVLPPPQAAVNSPPARTRIPRI